MDTSRHVEATFSFDTSGHAILTDDLFVSVNMSLVLPPPLPPWPPSRGPSVRSTAFVPAVPPGQRHERRARGTALPTALPPQPLTHLPRQAQSVLEHAFRPNIPAKGCRSGSDVVTSGVATRREPPLSAYEAQPAATVQWDHLAVSVSYVYDVMDLCVVRIDGTLSGVHAMRVVGSR